jgi:hypothetical protein
LVRAALLFAIIANFGLPDESLRCLENQHRLVHGDKVFVRRPQSAGVSSRAAVWAPDNDFLMHLEPGILETLGDMSGEV